MVGAALPFKIFYRGLQFGRCFTDTYIQSHEDASLQNNRRGRDCNEHGDKIFHHKKAPRKELET